MLNLESPYEIYQWAQSKRSEIERAFEMKGGWEGWLQVELGLQLVHPGIAVEREEHVFQNRMQAADMLITSSNGARAIVELKCEGVYQDCKREQGTVVAQCNKAGRPNFAARIEADLVKMGTDGGNIHEEYRGSWFYCIGFSLTREACDYAEQMSRNDELHFLAITPRKLYAEAERLGFIRTPGALGPPDPNDTLVMWIKSGRKA